MFSCYMTGHDPQKELIVVMLFAIPCLPYTWTIFGGGAGMLPDSYLLSGITLGTLILLPHFV